MNLVDLLKSNAERAALAAQALGCLDGANGCINIGYDGEILVTVFTGLSLSDAAISLGREGWIREWNPSRSSFNYVKEIAPGVSVKLYDAEPLSPGPLDGTAVTLPEPAQPELQAVS